ncbi:unnamed protein product [Effrenium voratum]|uniref:Uncharacterized protein n=1 Tax=Effrenium voratum TaxID=2562239 RepID=A0AA36IKV2_9DINO|nr:unnamed protein product [Effrenium voratum]
MAPDCSSFVFPNSSRTLRKKRRLAGDETYGPVQAGNDMARAAAFLLAVAVARGRYVVLENPSGSCIFSYLKTWLEVVPGAVKCIVHRCAYSNAPAGERWLKPYKFLAYGPGSLAGNWIWRAARRCRCPNGQMKLEASGVSGTPGLSASASYPKQLGEMLVKAWQWANDHQKDDDSYTYTSDSDSEMEASASSDDQSSDPDEFNPGAWQR